MKTKDVGFVDTIEKFLIDEKINHTKSGHNTITIKKYGADAIFYEDKCDTKESFSTHDMIDLDSHFMRTIPTKEEEVIKLIKFKDSNDLNIRSTMSLYKDKSRLGESILSINMKDVLLKPSEYDQVSTINCKCNQTRISCKIIKGI